MAKNEELSHWHVLIDGFQTSSLDFYDNVEAGIAAQQLPNVSTDRVWWNEGGVGSAKRIYLRVKRGRLMFDICGAPYGTGHFFSSWLTEQRSGFGLFAGCLIIVSFFGLLAYSVYENGPIVGPAYFAVGLIILVFFIYASASDEFKEDVILSLPLIGPVYNRYFLNLTFYRRDTRLMFLDSVHRVVTTVVQELNATQGLRALRPDELQPTMRAALK